MTALISVCEKRVLLVGDGEFYQIGAFFLQALESLKKEYRFVDEADYFKALGDSLFYRALARLLQPIRYKRFNRAVVEAASSFRPHTVLVIKGMYVSPQALSQIKSEEKAVLVNYATDNPFNPACTSRDITAAIPLYDLYATTKRSIIPDLRIGGARQVEWVPFAYEPTLHFPEVPKDPEEARSWASDVVFAGGCDEDRVHFFKRLASMPDIRLSLYGGYWDRVPELRQFWKGFVFKREYRLALAGSKIALCLVRHANRDGNVMRTFEIPACGAFMLAERTEEHLELFEEGKEMACFGSTEELVDKVRYYLAHDEERRRIAEAGYHKVKRCKYTYQDRLIEILKVAETSRGQ